MAWALVRENGSIYRKNESKYKLLKNLLETKEHISKKSVKTIRDGDSITTVFRKTYPKWFTNPKTGRWYQAQYEEVTEQTYTLRFLESRSQTRKRSEDNEKRTHLHTGLHANDMGAVRL